jgi:hypothetical protein
VKKIEFSKLVIVMLFAAYFGMLAFGSYITTRDTNQLGVLLAFAGSPVVTGVGFYFWKSKAENIIKYAKTLGKKDLAEVGELSQSIGGLQ